MSQALQNCMDLPPMSRKEWHKRWFRNDRNAFFRSIFACIVVFIIMGPIAYEFISFREHGAAVPVLIIIVLPVAFVIAARCENLENRKTIDDRYSRYLERYYLGQVDRIGRVISKEDMGLS